MEIYAFGKGISAIDEEVSRREAGASSTWTDVPASGSIRRPLLSFLLAYLDAGTPAFIEHPNDGE